MTDVLLGAPPTGAPTRRPLPAWAPLVGYAVAFALVAPCCLWTAAHAHPGPVLHQVALFAHLAFLVVGFGAVLAVDWIALQWSLRRRPLADVLRMATDVQLPIWGGYAGLVASGLLLEPDLSRGLTVTKLVLVLVIGWNGLVATALHRPLQGEPRRGLVVAAAACATVSQLGWWGAVVIGHLNAH